MYKKKKLKNIDSDSRNKVTGDMCKLKDVAVIKVKVFDGHAKIRNVISIPVRVLKMKNRTEIRLKTLIIPLKLNLSRNAIDCPCLRMKFL